MHLGPLTHEYTATEWIHVLEVPDTKVSLACDMYSRPNGMGGHLVLAILVEGIQFLWAHLILVGDIYNYAAPGACSIVILIHPWNVYTNTRLCMGYMHVIACSIYSLNLGMYTDTNKPSSLLCMVCTLQCATKEQTLTLELCKQEPHAWSII